MVAHLHFTTGENGTKRQAPLKLGASKGPSQAAPTEYVTCMSHALAVAQETHVVSCRVMTATSAVTAAFAVTNHYEPHCRCLTTTIVITIPQRSTMRQPLQTTSHRRQLSGLVMCPLCCRLRCACALLACLQSVCLVLHLHTARCLSITLCLG